MTQPDFSFEDAAIARGLKRVAGVDEVGRGPLAGPVVAAAVVLDTARIPEGLNDSKRLTAPRREALAEALAGCAEVAIGQASVEEIDRINILEASHLAMMRALAQLEGVDHVLVDGNRLPRDLTLSAEAVVKGDGRSQSIAAASVVAKVWRDRLMVDLAQHWPGYGWERNFGYPSKEHREALARLGVTPAHRRSFKPVRNML